MLAVAVLDRKIWTGQKKIVVRKQQEAMRLDIINGV
jgi:hypothetical protein